MAASFDCGKATAQVERLICLNPKLSDLDGDLAAAYQAALASTSRADSIRREQREWLKARNACGTVQCLEAQYDKRLSELEDETEPSSTADQPYRFRQTKGAGTEVCDAYLKRLQATHFEHPPYCGRPENDSVPGFSLLHRVALSATETFALYNRVEGLFLRGDQYWAEHQEEFWKAKNSTFRPAQATLKSVDASLKADFLRVWRYEPPIDVENGATPDNLVVWYGEGVGPSGYCGGTPSNVPEPLRVNQLPFFVAAAGNAIDVDRTMKVFGARTDNRSAALAGQPKEPHMIGSHISFFEYKGVYYFDTFLDASQDGQDEAKAYRLANTLAVFLNKSGETREMCEYHVIQ